MVYDKSLWLKSYDEWIKEEIEIKDNSLVDQFERIRAKYGDRPALHFLGKTITYEELMSYADSLANCLVDHGLQKGDVVAVTLPNTPQYVVTLLGTLKAGCALTGVSPLLTSNEIAYQLKDSGAKAYVVMDAIYEHRFRPIADQVPDVKVIMPTMLLDFLPKFKQLAAKWLKKVPTGKMDPMPNRDVIPFMRVLSSYPTKPPNVTITREDPFVIQYTGGTTGLPKGAVLTHANEMAVVSMFDHWFGGVEPGIDVLVSAYPMFHVAGLFTAITAMSFGAAQVLIPNPRDTKHMVKEMAVHKPQWLANVPSLYMMLLKEPGFHKLDFSRLKVAISAAAPTPAEVTKELERVFGEGKVIDIYGMTETSPLSSLTPYKGVHKIGSAGVPPPSTLLKIMDLENSEIEVPLGEEGEIIVSGPQVMKGYHNRPEETAHALREREGRIWMYTGDIGRMDEDGYLTIVDRAKDMVSVSGFKVFPREVEEKLYELPFVEFCAVIGVKNPDRPETEMVKLVVQKNPTYADKSDDELKEEIIAFAKENVAAYKVPKIIEFREVPLTAAGKVDKKQLR
jgi:long-chain acyl-CoA synthetase